MAGTGNPDDPRTGPRRCEAVCGGNHARASNENVRSLGYSIYYTLVNIGGALGPIVAWLVRKQLGWGIESVFRVRRSGVFLMFWTTLFFYREPGRSERSEGRERVDRALEI